MKKHYLIILIAIISTFYAGCGKDDGIEEIEESNEIPIANFSANPRSGLAPLTVTLTDHSENKPTSWLWTLGDNSTSSIKNPIRTYNDEGTYSVTLSVTNKVGSDTKTDTNYIIVTASNTNPEALFTVSPSNGTINTIFAFDASGSTDDYDPISNLLVRWDFDGNGSWDTDWDAVKTPNYQYSNDGSYNTQLEVKDTEGLISQYTKSIIVSHNAFGLVWVNVSGGTFQMGSNNGQSDEQPIHSVTVSSFEITKYEITNEQYCLFLNDIGCNSNGSYNGEEYINMNGSYCQINYSGGQFIPESGKTDFPVIEVSWYGGNAFAQWAGGRLPTEAEWEFAARGGVLASSTTYAGSNNINDVAWYNSNSGGNTHQVGTKAINELGIHDMSGNVWEWCNDWYSSSFYSSSPQNNPQGPSSGTYRVLRGGSWYHSANYCRVADRYRNYPSSTYHSLGFRIAR